jgi:hypothetical protein
LSSEEKIAELQQRIKQGRTRFKTRIRERGMPLIETVLQVLDRADGTSSSGKEQNLESTQLLQAFEDLKKQLAESEEKRRKIEEELEAHKKMNFSARVG